MSDYCRTPQAPGPCLCAPPGITRAGYAALLERCRAANVDREIDAWKQYEQDQTTAAHMRRLLKEG